MAEAARYFDRICDEMIDPEVLTGSQRPLIAALGRCLRRYRELLLATNVADFAHLQAWAERVMRDGDIAARAGEAVRRLMVDEFQDTSRIQLRILGRLTETRGNILVVGDDDQSTYRFMGAGVANLLQFPWYFRGSHVVKLATNYRSHKHIVATYSAWMETAADWSHPDRVGRTCRFEKDLAAHAPETHLDYPAVIAVQGANPRDEGRRLRDCCVS